MPLDPGEVQTPELSQPGGGTGRIAPLQLRRIFFQRIGLHQALERNLDFHGPEPVVRTRFIQSTFDMDGGFHTLHVPAGDGAAAVPIRMGEHQIPLGIPGIHFQLHIVVGGGAGVQKYFKIIVIVHDTVPLLDVRPDFRAFQQRGNIEVFIIPAQLRPGTESGGGEVVAGNVRKGSGKGYIFPEGFPDVPIQCQGPNGSGTEIYRRVQRNPGCLNMKFRHSYISLRVTASTVSVSSGRMGLGPRSAKTTSG